MEKKEIGKLLELLNEYLNDKIGYIQYHNEYGFKRTKTKSEVEGERFLQDEYVLGKKFGFVKRLVEQDKIDRDEIIINSDFMPIAFDRKGEKYEWSGEKQLLMLLSISDTPIEDLLLYLK